MKHIIEYTLLEEQPENYHFPYGNSYLVEIGWNQDLIGRIKNNKFIRDPGTSVIKDIALCSSVMNVLEKLGILFIDDEFFRQEIRKGEVRQYLIQFHFYHWLYDSVACLDSIASLLNAKYHIRKPEQVKLDDSFVREIKIIDEEIANLIEPELVWIYKLRKEMRNLILHREGRNITGGGNNEPCYTIDLLRMLDRNIPLNRVDVEEIIDRNMPRIEVLIKRTLEHLFPE